MSNSKGSKVALAVAGLILVAGAATAIAMTQSKGDNPLAIIGAEETSNATGAVKIPKIPAPDAEIGEAQPKSDPMADSKTEASPQTEEDGSAVPGMNNLLNNDAMTKEGATKEPAQKTE